ncbi:hemerythrin domain-containing protein [Cumulibacter manganitolerans]|uniref:hemerythrin domain-containing protein n=1 Tax=Cumulibacter manganitolerans TaxID=1884992 RepID=UPI003898FC97
MLAEQHKRIKKLFAAVDAAEGTDKQDAFDELRRLLAVHEVAEEMVLRPTTTSTEDTSRMRATRRRRRPPRSLRSSRRWASTPPGGRRPSPRCGTPSSSTPSTRRRWSSRSC